MAGRVLLKIVYLLVRRTLGLVVLVARRDVAKDAEPRRHIRYPVPHVGRSALTVIDSRREGDTCPQS